MWGSSVSYDFMWGFSVSYDFLFWLVFTEDSRRYDKERSKFFSWKIFLGFTGIFFNLSWVFDMNTQRKLFPFWLELEMGFDFY